MNPLNKLQQLIKISLVVASLLLAPIAAIAAETVNINRADAATMIENWKGIGEKKARAIVSYRKKNGNFASIEDLANVTGIGEGLIKNNRKYMSVSKGAFKPTGKTTAKSTTDKTAKTKPSKKSSNSKSKDSKSTTSKSKEAKSKDSKTSKAKKSTSKKPTKDSKTKKKSTSKTKKKDCTAKSKSKECKKKKKAKTT